MNTLVADALARFIVVLAVELGVLFLAAYALQGRIHGGALRRQLWQMAMLGAIALIGLELCGVGNATAAWASPWWRSAVAPQAPPTRWVTTVAKTPNRTTLDLGDSTIDDGLMAGATGRAATEQGRGKSYSWAGWGVWLWFTGTALVIAWLGIGRLLFSLVARRRPIQHTALLEAVRRLAALLGWQRPVAVTEIAGLCGPIAYGLWRPGLGLPPGFATQHSDTERHAMLAHELAHIAGRDPLWQLLADLLAAVLWWHPMVWMARRCFRDARELSADEASAVVEGGPAALAGCLVLLGQHLLRHRPSEKWNCGWLGVEGMAFRSGLGRRVERLVSLRAPRRRSFRARLFLGACGMPLVVALIVLATSWARDVSLADGMKPGFRTSVLGMSLLAFVGAEAPPAPPAPSARPAQPAKIPDPAPATNALDVAAIPAPALFTRWFKVEMNALQAKLGADSALARAKPEPVATGAAFTEDLRTLLAKSGFDTSAARRLIFFNDRNGMLMLRGTQEELAVAETVLAELNGSTTQPQILIEVKIIELPETTVRQLGSEQPSDASAELLAVAGIDWRTNANDTFSHVLTTPQTRVLLRALEQQAGTKMLTAPKVTTLSGRQAQIKTVDVRSILYGFEAVTNKPPPGPDDSVRRGPVTTRPLVKSVELGPVVDIIPLLQPNPRMLTLTVTASIKEFLGYDNAESSAPVLPLPRFRQYQISATGSVEDGQTLVLAGGTVAEENVDATGRVVPAPAPRTDEQPTGEANELVRRSRLICLTPRLVDPAGNPVHP